MRKFLKNEALILVIVLLPFLFIALKWNEFPDRVPTHFNIKGVPDNYSDKFPGLLILPLANLAVYLMMLFVPKIDPKKSNIEKFKDRFKVIRVFTHLFMAFVFGLVAAYSLGYDFDFAVFMVYGLLTLFLVIGNYLGTVRHNYVIGVRTPWTLDNEEVWTRTHRFTARLWVVASIAMMIVYPFLMGITSVMVIFIVVITVIPVVYSYLLHKKIAKVSH